MASNVVLCGFPDERAGMVFIGEPIECSLASRLLQQGDIYRRVCFDALSIFKHRLSLFSRTFAISSVYHALFMRVQSCIRVLAPTEAFPKMLFPHPPQYVFVFAFRLFANIIDSHSPVSDQDRSLFPINHFFPSTCVLFVFL